MSNVEMVDDKVLVSRVLSGDMQAFRALIKKHERLVAHMIGRVVKQEEDREELCQDVFMKVYDNLANFHFQSQLSTWIATIAYRQAINHLRKRKILLTELPEVESDVADSVSDEIAEQDLETYLLKLIETLPIQYKTVLTLYHLEHKNYAEIGEITGMPDGTVKNYLFRARQLLKDKAAKYYE